MNRLKRKKATEIDKNILKKPERKTQKRVKINIEEVRETNQENEEPQTTYSLKLLNELDSIFLVKHPPEILEFWEWAKKISTNPKGNF